MEKILLINGSLRKESYNGKLLRAVSNELAKTTRFETTFCPNLDLPLLNEDLEGTNLPQSVLEFRSLLKAHSIVWIASPEYNGAPSGPLKNAIDWATRPPENLWAGKICVISSASPGALGGARGLIQLRTILSGIKCWVIPEQVQCSVAHEAFSPDGALQNGAVVKQIQSTLTGLQSFLDWR
jgi:chromate reductase, NAD(P)H dehydrogenase (quinone)